MLRKHVSIRAESIVALFDGPSCVAYTYFFVAQGEFSPVGPHLNTLTAMAVVCRCVQDAEGRIPD